MRINHYKTGLGIILLILFAFNLNASQLTFGGSITTNTNWNTDTILISSNVTVNNGVTLTIASGTYVEFQGLFALNIQGRLIAIGTSTSKIIFTPANIGTGWRGINFYNTSSSNDTSVVEHCIIKYAKADGSSAEEYYGGGIHVYNFSKLIIRNNIISNNWSYYSGGAIACRYSSAKIINNVIVNNTADYSYGGGIYTFASNSSYVPWIINNTIANNQSITAGAGIYRNSGAIPVFRNNIVWGNTSSSYGTDEQVYPNSITNLQYCNIEGGTYSGTGNISNDPLLISPTLGAGVNYDGASGDWSIRASSYCIDAGTTSSQGLGLPSTDLVGNQRLSNSAIDMGAFEKKFIDFCGPITSDTTWTSSNAIMINCDIEVPNGVKLTVSPGTEIVFNGSYILLVKGTIYASGNESNKISFTAKNTINGWKGLKINPNTGNDSSIVHYCQIDYVKTTGHTTGGVIIYEYDKARISNCRIENNIIGSTFGGGISLYVSDGVVKNNIIKNNYGTYGGGIYVYDFNGLISNNIVEYNRAYWSGGGMYISYSNSKIIGNKINNNRTLYSHSNSLQGGGGVVCIGNEASTFINNLIVNNQSADYGGGVRFEFQSKALFINNTIANNYAVNYGGGIAVESNADPSFINCILYGDSAGNATGGNEVYINDIFSDPKFYNCIINGGDTSFAGNGAQSNYNRIYIDNLNSDPSFTAPSSGVGYLYDGGSADWNIDTYSPCINAGVADTSGLGYIETDLAGLNRIHNGRIDIGAYENQQDIYAKCNILTNTIWDADTIKVSCNITISNGVTLRISPGTYVEFQGFYKIVVQGRLLAEGTANAPITFSIHDTTGFYNGSSINGGWNGIDFISTPNTNDTSKISFCRLQYGKDTHRGGAIYIYNYSKVVVSNSILANNKAYTYGGAICLYTASPIIKNCIICNNSTTTYNTYYGGGGAIYMDDSSPLIYNNTIVHNYSSRYVGGIYSFISNPVLSNNIIYNNSSLPVASSNYLSELLFTQGSYPSLSNNNIKGGVNGIGISSSSSYIVNTNNINQDPMFVNPSDGIGANYNGLNADWRISPNSPCINAGAPGNTGMFYGSKDYNGNARIIADTIDIGHYEVQMSERFIDQQPTNVSSCIGTSVSLTASINVNASYQWQKDGVDISGASSSTLNLNNLNLSNQGYYSCVFTNDFGIVESDSVFLEVQIPPTIITSPSSASRCLGDSVSFTMRANGTHPLHYQWQDINGNLQSASSLNNQIIGNADTTNSGFSYPAPYGNYYYGAKHQFIIRASELKAYGFIAGDIRSLALHVASINNSPALANFTLRIGLTSDSSLTNNWINGLTTVYSNPSYQPESGWNIHNFQTPFTWDGTSNLVIETCFNNNVWTSNGNASFYLSTTAYNSSHVYRADNTSVCSSNLTTSLFNRRPQFKIEIATSISRYSITSISQNNATTYKCEVSNMCGSQLSNGAVLSIKTPPSITSLPGTYTLCETNPIPLSVNVTGTPSPTVQWFKNDTALSGKTNFQLNIAAASASDQGIYYCKAINECGADSSNLSSVIINQSPIINNQSPSSSVCEGQSITLWVSASGAQPLSYQWYKNSSPIYGAIGNTYSLNNVNSSYGGTYVCRVTNPCGFVESSAIIITTKSAPLITAQTTSTSICSGSSQLFSVTASGSTPLTYQWYNSAGAISAATNNTYSASVADDYYCMVTNSCGTISSNTMTLTVNSSPSITSQPTNTTKCLGQSAQFTILASGSPSPSYQWYNSTGAISGATNSNYIISPVSLSDAGTYYCTVSNSCGSTQSNSVSLTTTTAPTITAQTPSASICSGANHLFSITASGTAPLTYQWYNSSGAISNATNNTYAATSAGNFYCVVSNLCGNASSNFMNLSVNTAPTITSQPLNLTKCVGQSAQFSIVANGTAPLSYQWYNSTGAIPGAISSTYIISPVSQADAGSYYCIATNSCGTAQSNLATLTVNNPVQITIQSGDSSRCVGESMTFNVQATGTLPITYQWYNTTGIISGATNNTYAISAVSLADAGYYYCMVNNGCGTVQSTYKTLTINSLPSANLGNDTTFCSGNNLTISPGFGYNVLWNTGSFNPQLNVTQTGSYYCTIFDQNGCKGYSDTININVSLPFANEQVCIVGVDSATEKNIIVWEKTPNVGVASYNVYKESSVTNVFNLIANKPVDSLSTFIDYSSNPVVKRDRYAISSIDTCGNESALSPVHATMHLSISPYLGGGWTLNWQGYEGFTVATYYIWRVDPGQAPTLIDSVAATTLQYNDTAGPAQCIYYINLLKPGPSCFPTSSKASTNYNTSRSNKANTGAVTPPFLIVDFAANVFSGNWPLQVKFLDGTLGSPTEWKWDFGDGNTSIEQNPVHTYNNTGLYSIQLKACNGIVCDSITKTNFINVQSNGIEGINVGFKARLYPNPNDGNFYLEISDESQHLLNIEIYNAIGQRLFTESFVSHGIMNKKIVLNSLSPGIYFIHLKDKSRLAYREKFIVK